MNEQTKEFQAYTFQEERMCQRSRKESKHNQKFFLFWKLRWIFRFHYDANYRARKMETLKIILFLCSYRMRIHILSNELKCKKLVFSALGDRRKKSFDLNENVTF